MLVIEQFIIKTMEMTFTTALEIPSQPSCITKFDNLVGQPNRKSARPIDYSRFLEIGSSCIEFDATREYISKDEAQYMERITEMTRLVSKVLLNWIIFFYSSR